MQHENCRTRTNSYRNDTDWFIESICRSTKRKKD